MSQIRIAPKKSNNSRRKLKIERSPEFSKKKALFWYNGAIPQKPTKEKTIETEGVAKEILEKEGFSNIKRANKLFGERFLTDYYAEKDKKKYLIEITCGQRKELLPKIKEFIKLFNLEYVYIFVKPDFSIYSLVNLDPKIHTYYWHQGKLKPFRAASNVNPYILFFDKVLQPFNWNNIQQVGYDLTLKNVFEISGSCVVGDKMTHAKRKQIKCTKGSYKLKAGKLYSFDFFEYVKIPNNMFALIYPRSSLNRMGCLLTSGIYDSGFENYVGAMARIFQCDIEIKKQSRVAQMLFQWADAASEYSGQYQGKNL